MGAAALGAPRSQKECKEGLQALKQRFPCSPWRCFLEGIQLWRAHVGANIFLKDSSPWEGPVLECGKVGRGRSSRGELLWTDHSSCSPPLGCSGRGVRNVGVKLNLQKDGGRKEQVLF